MATNQLKQIVFALALLCLLASSGSAADYETIRFYTQNSKPEKLAAYAFSPNGQYLALSFKSGTGSHSGVSVADLGKQELSMRAGSFSFFTLAFSSNSQKLLGIGGYAGVQQFDLKARSVQRIRNTGPNTGKLGISVIEKNGKLLIGQVFNDVNPGIGDRIRVGDELLAINAGQKAQRYNDSREWQPLVGKPVKKALKILSGEPGTWVQLRLSRLGSSEPVEVEVQRQWSDKRPGLPPSGASLTLSRNSNAIMLWSANRARVAANISLRDLPSRGQQAISPDATRYAMLARVKDGRDFVVEVHSLETGELEASTVLQTNNYRHLRFSPDSQQVLVGTRDTVEIYDIATGWWRPPVVLTPPEEVDPGRVTNRRIPLGLGFPGDLFTTSREVVYSKPAALAVFDVSSDGVLAVGSETGEVVLASLETKDRIGVVGDGLLGAAPNMIEFSPTGEHLVAYAKGILHILQLDESKGNSFIETAPAGETDSVATP